MKNSFFLRIVENLDKDVKSFRNDVHNISWLVEIAKAILTSVVLIIISTLFLSVVFSFSPGEYYGEKLNGYFEKCICKKLNIKDSLNNFEIDKTIENSDDDIFVIGYYCSVVMMLRPMLKMVYIFVLLKGTEKLFGIRWLAHNPGTK